MCAPYPPQVASNGPNLLGDLIPGGSYLGEVKGISIAEPTSKKFLYTASDPSMGLHRGEVSEDSAYVGATWTLTGAGCAIAGESKEIVAYAGATRKATLDSASQMLEPDTHKAKLEHREPHAAARHAKGQDWAPRNTCWR